MSLIQSVSFCSLSLSLVFLRPSLPFIRRISLSFLLRWLRRALGIPTELIGHLCSTYRHTSTTCRERNEGRSFDSLASLYGPHTYIINVHIIHGKYTILFLYQSLCHAVLIPLLIPLDGRFGEGERARHSSLTSPHI